MIKFFVLSISFIFYCNVGSANIFRVNSSLTTNAAQKIYRTIQEANSASVVLAGDTLMIEGSAVQYDGASISKRLILIGPGYFLSENTQTQASPQQAVVQGISIQNSANGSALIGLSFSSFSSNYTPSIEASNILIMRCYLTYPVTLVGSISNIQIVQNYFNTSAVALYSSNYTFTGVSLKNNIIGSSSGESINIFSNTSSQRIFSNVENNIFKGSITLTASTFRSNVIVTSTSTVTVSSANIQNNLVSNGQIPATNGNQTYDPANLFVGASGNSTDGQYKLKPTSPYLTAGFANTQPGIFGGIQAYVLSGLPPIPSIFEFTADGIANKQTGLPINIKVKANQ